MAWGLVCVCVIGVLGLVLVAGWWGWCWLVGGGCGACVLLVCLGRVLGLVLAGLVGVVLLVGALVCFCGGLVFLVCWVYCVCLLFRVWCVRRVLRVLAFVVGCVVCAFFGSVLAGCVSGGVFGVCGFRSPARAPLVWVWDEMGGGACAAVFVVGSAPFFFLVAWWCVFVCGLFVLRVRAGRACFFWFACRWCVCFVSASARRWLSRVLVRGWWGCSGAGGSFCRFRGLRRPGVRSRTVCLCCCCVPGGVLVVFAYCRGLVVVSGGFVPVLGDWCWCWCCWWWLRWWGCPGCRRFPQSRVFVRRVGEFHALVGVGFWCGRARVCVGGAIFGRVFVYVGGAIFGRVFVCVGGAIFGRVFVYVGGARV